MRSESRGAVTIKAPVPVLALFLAVAFAAGSSFKDIKPASQQEKELDAILKRCADYCEKLSHSVLHFICQEEIKEEHWGHIYRPLISEGRRATNEKLARFYRDLAEKPGTVVRIKYRYDYQLIRKNDQITENRRLLEWDGREREEENARLQTKFHHKNIILGPIGLLSSYWQLFHDYRILKEEKIRGERAYVVEAVPAQDFSACHLFGRIWIKENDFSVLKIEWQQEGIEGYESIKERAESFGFIPNIKLTAEYAFEKSGIRFPSRYEIEERYRPLQRWGRKRAGLLYSKIVVEYSDYQFFTVEVDIKY